MGEPLIERLRRRLQARRHAHRVLRSGLFDPQWYLQAYPDVAAARLAPLAHYLQFGAREGRDPSPAFETEAYLARHPDVAAAGANPLLHYVLHGASEGRALPSPRRDAAGWQPPKPGREVSLAATLRRLVGRRFNAAETAAPGWVLARLTGPPGALDRLILEMNDGQVRDLALCNGWSVGATTLLFWPDDVARARTTTQTPVSVRELSRAEAIWRILRAHGWRKVNALRSRGIEIWLREQAERSPALPLDDYQRWAWRHDTPSATQLDTLAERVARLPDPARFSLVVPVYDTEPRALREMIDSVRRQVYPHWQLCLADDASPSRTVRAVLRRAAREDARIVVAFRPRNGHIAAATNTAIGLARHEWLAMLDHDDVLAPHALATMALAIAANPETDLLYSDQDTLDAQGRRANPYFKPDFNPELLRAQNFLNHLTVYRAGAVRAAGGMREGFDGSQDYDLALRVVAATRRPVIHVPHILYHWRIHDGADNFSMAQAARATDAARRALRDDAAARGEAVEVVTDAKHWHRVLRPPPHWPRVTAIVPTRDHLDVLRCCIEGLLRATDYPALEIIIVDNASVQPETLSWLEAIADQGVRVLRYRHPFNFSAINNLAARHAQGEILLLLNSDVAVTDKGWLREMVQQALRPGVAAVGAKLLYPDSTVQHAGIGLGVGGGVASHPFLGAGRDDPGPFGRLILAQDVAAVTAACMVVHAHAFSEIGGLDAVNLPVAFNDVDFCLRLRAAGWRVVWTPHAVLHHWESRSRGSEYTPERIDHFNAEIAYMKRRWRTELARDPFINPNLTLDPWPRWAAPPRVAAPWATADEAARRC